MDFHPITLAMLIDRRSGNKTVSSAWTTPDVARTRHGRQSICGISVRMESSHE